METGIGKRGIDERPLENGTYTISNATNSKQVLDIASAVETDYANIQMYASIIHQHRDLNYIMWEMDIIRFFLKSPESP